MQEDSTAMVRRIEKLERSNRTLMAALIGLGLLGVVGWRTQPTPEALKVSKLEVVDGRGVPMVILETGRKGEGGQITLRDSLGEKRGWWQVSPDGSSLTMSAESGSENASTAGFGVTPKSARVSLISPKGASLSAAIEADQPRLDLYNPAGKVLFGAPWKPAR
jgi:hypothetical protein